FLRHIDGQVRPTHDVHIVVDNFTTHKHPRVKRWIAARPRLHVHHTPTYTSWLNQVEIWFTRIRRGTFSSVKELIERIDRFIRTYNETACLSSGPPSLNRFSPNLSGCVH